jgi:hypothetical protein
VLAERLTSQMFEICRDRHLRVQARGPALPPPAEPPGRAAPQDPRPTSVMPISPTMTIAVPRARSISPVTGTNWEGTGVIPDIAVPAADAYDVAYRAALEHVLGQGAPPPVTDEARAVLAELPPASQP